MKVIKDISYGDGSVPRQYLDIYLPEAKAFSVLVYFHGGGLQNYSKDAVSSEGIAQLADRGIAVVAVNYRLYPFARYPEFIMDAAAATAWAYKNMAQYGDCKGVFVCGSSAGAYLAMMLCMDKRYLAPHGIDPDTLAGYIFDAGQPTVHFSVLQEYGFDSRKVIVDERAPLYHIGKDRNYPPMLLLCGEQDIESRYEQTMLFLSTLRHFGHENAELVRMDAKYKHDGYVKEPVFRDLIERFISDKSRTEREATQ